MIRIEVFWKQATSSLRNFFGGLMGRVAEWQTQGT